MKDAPCTEELWTGCRAHLATTNKALPPRCSCALDWRQLRAAEYLLLHRFLVSLSHLMTFSLYNSTHGADPGALHGCTGREVTCGGSCFDEATCWKRGRRSVKDLMSGFSKRRKDLRILWCHNTQHTYHNLSVGAKRSYFEGLFGEQGNDKHV